MAALTTERQTDERVPALRNLPVAEDAIIYAGAGVVLDAGVAKPATAAPGLLSAGRAEETVDNTGGEDGDKTVRVKRGCFRFANGADADEIGLADVGATAYWIDDQTVGLTDDGGGRSAAGPVFDVDEGGVWVQLGDHETLLPALQSGNYAPTMAGITNVTGTPTATGAKFLRVGDVVHVVAEIAADPTAGSDTETVVSMTLPIASDLGAADLHGVAGAAVGAKAGSVYGDATTNTARIRFTSSSTDPETFRVSFSYEIV